MWLLCHLLFCASAGCLALAAARWFATGNDLLETLDDNTDLRDQIICYINPLNRGTIFTRNEVTLYLKKIQEEPRSEHYLPIRNRDTIKLYLEYLKQGYLADNNPEKAKELDGLIGLF